MVNVNMVSTAARILGISESTARENSEEVAGHPLIRFWKPIRGGGVIIMGEDLSYLRHGPSTNPELAVERYLSGERTTPSPADE